MKIKDFIEKTNWTEPVIKGENTDKCDLCDFHKTFIGENFFDQIECPCCRNSINFSDFQFTAVGETNCVNPEEEIWYTPIARCDDCGKTIALMPKAIIWNANHDIYLTGGKNHLAEEIDIISQIIPLIEAYDNRLIERPEHLATRISHKIESVIAEYLQKRGL